MKKDDAVLDRLFVESAAIAEAAAAAVDEADLADVPDHPKSDVGLRLLRDRGLTSQAIEVGLRKGHARKLYGMCIVLAPREMHWGRKTAYVTALEQSLVGAGLDVVGWVWPPL